MRPATALWLTTDRLDQPSAVPIALLHYIAAHCRFMTRLDPGPSESLPVPELNHRKQALDSPTFNFCYIRSGLGSAIQVRGVTRFRLALGRRRPGAEEVFERRGFGDPGGTQAVQSEGPGVLKKCTTAKKSHLVALGGPVSLCCSVLPCPALRCRNQP